jgi:hypothetical protein
LDRKAHVKKLHKEGQFERMYRMSYTSFKKLLALLKPYLLVNERQGNCRTGRNGPLTPELILHCLIRYMAGGSHHDIRVLAGLPISPFLYYLHRGMDAVNRCPQLSLEFPMDHGELKRVALEFQGKSSFGVTDGCVGALDGWLCCIKVPIGREASNISSYFSGHYQCYGINVQAVSDSRCRFIYLSCRSPGGTGDSRAFMALLWATSCRESLEVFILLEMQHTPCLPCYWSLLVEPTKEIGIMMFSIFICPSWESRLSRHLGY